MCKIKPNFMDEIPKEISDEEYRARAEANDIMINACRDAIADLFRRKHKKAVERLIEENQEKAIALVAKETGVKNSEAESTFTYWLECGILTAFKDDE